jgi:AraC-like DNA-binding protein
VLRFLATISFLVTLVGKKPETSLSHLVVSTLSMQAGLVESMGSLPFIKLPGASLASSEPSGHGTVVGTFLPFHVYRWDHPQRDQPFINHSGFLRLGDLTLLGTWGSGIDGEVEQKCEAQLILPYLAGVNAFTIDQQTFTTRSSSFFIPATRAKIKVVNTMCSGVVISFSPDSLLPVAHAIAGPGFDPLPLLKALERPAVLSRRADPRIERLHNLLMETMAYAERCLVSGGAVNPMLRLDDLIRRLVVMLLVPDLLDAATAAAPISDPFLHQQLVDWLLAHLDQPMSLSELEQRSSYSRRALQYAFKQRFGCGPMQWLRQQRLAKARALLEQPLSSGGLTQVAQACGYLCQGSFSRDFLARYGERPSQVQRRFRDADLLERFARSATAAGS